MICNIDSSTILFMLTGLFFSMGCPTGLATETEAWGTGFIAAAEKHGTCLDSHMGNGFPLKNRWRDFDEMD